MASPGDAFLGRSTEQLRMQVKALLPLRFPLLDWNAMGVGPCVLPDAGHLPGNLHVRFVGLDGELSIGDLIRDDGLCECADYGELVSEVAIQNLEPVGHSHHGVTLRIGGDLAVVDV